MGRKPRVDRSPEEKWQIVQEGIKSGNVSETCRRHGIAPNLFYRWKDEAEQGAKAALGGRSAAAAETEKDHRIRQLERTLGRKSLEIEIQRFTPQRPFQLPYAMVLLGFGRGSASPPKRCLRSLFRFIFPTIEQIRSDSVTPTRLRDVPALDTFLHDLT